MKRILLFLILTLMLAAGYAQQVLINPTSVTLTKQGSVTVIVTGKIIGHNVSFDAYLNVTVGSIKASLYHAIYANDGTSVGSWLNASSASSGTLDTGTYPVTTEINMDGWDNPNPDPATFPRQITVILWNESANTQGPSLSDIELTYNSANSTDQAAFQAFITSLVQQQLNNLQGQINDHLSRITALEQASGDHQSEINALQEELGTLQGSLAQLQTDLGSLATRVAALEQQLAHLSITNGTDGANGKNGQSANNTLGYIGIGLGGAGLLGSVINFFTGSGSNDDTSSTDAPAFQEGSGK